MKKIFYLLVVLLSFSILGCTENQKAKIFGGNMTVSIPSNEKFINATWKEANLWIITQDTISRTYYMHEISDYGVFQGTVIIK